jgi:hypothetical protein
VSDRAYAARNTAEEERLRTLLSRTGDAGLSTPLDDGWTVAGVLAHLAFWERFELVRHDRWQLEDVAPTPIDWEAVNRAGKPEWLALPPREAAASALAAVAALNRRLEALTDAQLEAIAGAGRSGDLDQSEHRAEHLDAIERALAVIPRA